MATVSFAVVATLDAYPGAFERVLGLRRRVPDVLDEATLRLWFE